MQFTRTLQAGVTATLLSLASAGVFAQAASTAAPAPAATPGIDHRQAMQEKRIDQGQANGQLTRRESRRLDHQQAHINKAESAAKADGTVTHAERKRLHAMQGHADKNIRHQKHDGQQARHGQRRVPAGGPGTGVQAAPGG